MDTSCVSIEVTNSGDKVRKADDQAQKWWALSPLPSRLETFTFPSLPQSSHRLPFGSNGCTSLPFLPIAPAAVSAVTFRPFLPPRLVPLLLRIHPALGEGGREGKAQGTDCRSTPSSPSPSPAFPFEFRAFKCKLKHLSSPSV